MYYQTLYRLVHTHRHKYTYTQISSYAIYTVDCTLKTFSTGRFAEGATIHIHLQYNNTPLACIRPGLVSPLARARLNHIRYIWPFAEDDELNSRCFIQPLLLLLLLYIYRRMLRLSCETDRINSVNVHNMHPSYHPLSSIYHMCVSYCLRFFAVLIAKKILHVAKIIPKHTRILQFSKCRDKKTKNTTSPCF